MSSECYRMRERLFSSGLCFRVPRDSIVEKTRQVGRDQTKTELLAMDMATAEGLLEKRYIGLDLLEHSDHKATTGGVTPVVVESPHPNPVTRTDYDVSRH
jgi:hypothetical protein